jgi:hypothetical protein
MKQSANVVLLFMFFSSFGFLSEKIWAFGGDNQTVAMPDFRGADGWFGADDAYSFPGRSLRLKSWLHSLRLKSGGTRTSNITADTAAIPAEK